MKFSAKAPVTKKSPAAWYMPEVNISYSFKTLERIATDLGAIIEDGDVLIVDNKNMDKRKAFKKTKNGCIILYVQLLNHNIFQPYETGEISDTSNKLLDFFNA